MKPYSRFMIQAIQRIRSLDIDAVCPGHGPILRKHWKRYIDLFEKYAREALGFPLPNRVFVGYVSAYRNTGRMAEEGLMVRFTPHEDTIKRCHEFGQQFGEKLLKSMKEQDFIRVY